jgi:AcrR family transcriptional regulator
MSDLHFQIITAAKPLMVDQGYRGLSMREIAEAVGVSKAALYYHFQDKEQLLLAILESNLADIEQLIDTIRHQAQSSHQRIHLLIKNILTQPADQRAIIRLASQEMPHLSEQARRDFNRLYHQKFLSKIEAMFVDGMRSGDLRDIDPSVATWSMLGMMYPYFYPAHAQELPAPDDVADQLADIFLSGLAVK